MPILRPPIKIVVSGALVVGIAAPIVRPHFEDCDPPALCLDERPGHEPHLPHELSTGSFSSLTANRAITTSSTAADTGFVKRL